MLTPDAIDLFVHMKYWPEMAAATDSFKRCRPRWYSRTRFCAVRRPEKIASATAAKRVSPSPIGPEAANALLPLRLSDCSSAPLADDPRFPSKHLERGPRPCPGLDCARSLW